MEKDPQEISKYELSNFSQYIEDLQDQLSNMVKNHRNQEVKLEQDKNINETALNSIKINNQIQQHSLINEIQQMKNTDELSHRISHYLHSYIEQETNTFDIKLEAKVEITNLEAQNPITCLITPELAVTEVSAEQLSKLSNEFSHKEESHLTKKDKIKEDNKIQKRLKNNTVDPKSFNGLIIRKNQYQVITNLEFLINIEQLFMRNTGITLTVEKTQTSKKIEKDKGTLSYRDYDKEKGIQNILYQRKPLTKDGNIVYTTEFYDEITKQRYRMKIFLAMQQEKDKQPISVYELKKIAEQMNEITYGNKKVKEVLLKIIEYNKEQIEEIILQINENAHNIIRIKDIIDKLYIMINDHEDIEKMIEHLYEIVENKENLQEIIKKINNDIYDEKAIKDITKQLNEITKDNEKIKNIKDQLDSMIKSEQDSKEEMTQKIKKIIDSQEQTKKIIEKEDQKTDKTIKTKKLNYQERIIKEIKEQIKEMQTNIQEINIDQEKKEEMQEQINRMKMELTTINNYQQKIEESKKSITETQEIIQQLDKITDKQKINIKLQDVKVTSCFCEIDSKHRLEREKLPTEIKFQE